MPEMLQNTTRSNGSIKAPICSTRLILNDDFAAQAISIIEDAKSEIRLCAYAWKWYAEEPEIGIQKLNVALLRAVRRGVVVHALVDTNAVCTNFRALGFDCRSVVNNRMLHTKAICVDRKSLVVGSHNLTKRAITDNYEMSIITQDFEPLEQFITYFDGMWASRANS